MKIYEYSRGVYGMSVVVAETPEDAVAYLKLNEVRDYEDITVEDLTGNEIHPGLVLDNLGDA